MDASVQQLETKIEQSTTPTDHIDALNDLAWHIFKQDGDRARQIANEILELATQTPFSPEEPYQRGRAGALRVLGRLASYEGRFESAINLSLEALNILEEINYPAYMPGVLTNLAGAYRKLGNRTECVKYYHRQQEISQQIGDDEGYGSALVGIGISYYDQQNYTEAFKYLEESLTVFRKANKTYWVALVLNNISYLLMKYGKPEEGLARGYESLLITQQNNLPRMEVSIHSTIAEIHLVLGDHSQAREFAQLTIQLASMRQYRDAHATGLRIMGESYARIKQWTPAIKYLQEALTLSEEIGHKQFIHLCHDALSETYEGMGDYKSALKHYRLFHEAKESVYNEENERKLQNLQVQFNTEAAQKEASYYASLYEQEQAQRHFTLAMNEIGRALTADVDLADVIAKILDQLATLIPHDRSALLLWHDNSITCLAARGFTAPEKHQPLPLPSNSDALLHIFQKNQPIITPDLAATFPEYEQYPFLLAGSWLGAPLIQQNKVIGCISLSRQESTPFSDEGVTLAMSLALQTAVALDNAQLYQQAQRRAHEMTTIAQIGQDISSSLDLDTVLNRIAHHAHKLFNASNTILWLRQQEADSFHGTIAIGDYAEQFLADVVLLGEGVTGVVAETGIAEIINDIDHDPRSQHVSGTPEEEEEQNLMCAPIVAQDETIGVMSLYRDRQLGPFTKIDLNFLIGISRQAAIALQNAQLYQQVTRFNEALEKEVARRTADLQTTLTELEQMERTKAKFIAITAHELRTPVAVLKGYGQLMKQSPQNATSFIDGIISGANRLHTIVNSMLMMVKIDNRALQLNLQSTSLELLIRRLVRDFAEDVTNRQQILTTDPDLEYLPRVMGDRESLNLVIGNIIRNAIKYTPDGGTIHIHGRHWTTPAPPHCPPHAV
ncbi:MAG TPA: GAF domain-containing protein, partial [Anaerolineae bacterium]|nr:GAF domain-containing protein [Anaerolineae bacterium]